MKDGLNLKYTYSQIKDFSREIIKNILKHLIIDGSFSLNLNSFVTNSMSLKILVQGLRYIKNITTINLRVNNIGQISKRDYYSFTILIGGLKDIKNLTSLNLAGNNLGYYPEYMKILMTGLKENINITTINLKGNHIGANSESLKIFIQGLKDIKQITTLDFNIIIVQIIIGYEYLD